LEAIRVSDNSFKDIGEKFGSFDIAHVGVWPVRVQWPYIHMMPEETVQAALDLQAKVFLPVHWGKFTLPTTHGEILYRGL